MKGCKHGKIYIYICLVLGNNIWLLLQIKCESFEIYVYYISCLNKLINVWQIMSGFTYIQHALNEILLIRNTYFCTPVFLCGGVIWRLIRIGCAKNKYSCQKNKQHYYWSEEECVSLPARAWGDRIRDSHWL